MFVMPRPVPSIETKRSICPFRPSLNRYFTPRRSPRPSSPTLPTKVIVPGVLMPSFIIVPRDREHHGEAAAVVADARAAQDRAFALHLDVGAFREHGVEMRARTRGAAWAAAPGRSPSTLPTLSMRTFGRPASRNICA